MSDNAHQTREHQWEAVPESEGSIWEIRRCRICHLQDQRIKNEAERRPFTDWKVNTPCAEPVPETIPFSVLREELNEHRVIEKPLVIGVPGDWSVGFCLPCRHGRSVLPEIKVKTPDTLEHGFAELLRWIRARQYNVNRYSQYDYMKRLYNSSCPCEDDD